jgi:hypothetical protein
MKKFILSILLFPNLVSAQMSEDSVSTLPKTALDVYYNMHTGQKDTVRANNWHLAFAVRKAQYPMNTMQATTIRINDGQGVEVYQSNQALANWGSFDTTNFTSWPSPINSDKTWDIGAFNQGKNLQDPFDYGWGAYNMNTNEVVGKNIWLLTDARRSMMKKIYISKIVFDTMWIFTISNLDGTDSNTIEIRKPNYKGKLHAYYNVVNNKVLDREPSAGTWNILFTKYKSIVTLMGQTLPYPVMGVLLSPNTMGARLKDAAVASMELKDSTLFTHDISTIGWDWKVAGTPGLAPIVDSLGFFLHDVNAPTTNTRIIFTEYYSGQGSQYTKFNLFTYALPTTGISEQLNGSLEINIYPNPVTGNGTLTLETKNSKATQISIVGLDGKVVFEQNMNGSNENIQLPSLQSGIYMVNIQTQYNKTSRKLLVY